MEAIRKLRDQVAKQQQVATDGGFGCKAVVGRHRKVDYPPFGRDFVNHQPTGRFCIGKLATDISSAASKAESFYSRATIQNNFHGKSHGFLFLSSHCHCHWDEL